MLPDLDRLNDADEQEFVDGVSVLFENAPGLAARLAEARPFSSYEELIDQAERLAASMGRDEQRAILDGHPRIGADPAALSAISYREQGYDRAPPTTDAAPAERLGRLNERYEDRFGFRFVVFVNGRSRAEIAELMEGSLHADPDTELDRALADVFAIARSRLKE